MILHGRLRNQRNRFAPGCITFLTQAAPLLIEGKISGEAPGFIELPPYLMRLAKGKISPEYAFAELLRIKGEIPYYRDAVLAAEGSAPRVALPKKEWKSARSPRLLA